MESKPSLCLCISQDLVSPLSSLRAAVGLAMATTTSGIRHFIRPPLSAANWLCFYKQASSQPANTRWHSLISVSPDRRNTYGEERKKRRDPNRTLLISTPFFLLFFFFYSDNKTRLRSGGIKGDADLRDENGLNKLHPSLEHHHQPSFIHYLDNLWLWLTAGVAKSHETRQFSSMQVVDGLIVTFTLAQFSSFFSFQEEENKTNRQTFTHATISSQPDWRIGRFAKLFWNRNRATKSLSEPGLGY